MIKWLHMVNTSKFNYHKRLYLVKACYSSLGTKYNWIAGTFDTLKEAEKFREDCEEYGKLRFRHYRYAEAIKLDNLTDGGKDLLRHYNLVEVYHHTIPHYKLQDMSDIVPPDKNLIDYNGSLYMDTEYSIITMDSY